MQVAVERVVGANVGSVKATLKVLLCAALLIAASCDQTERPPAGSPPNEGGWLDQLEVLYAEHDSARLSAAARWNASGRTSYRVETRISCFCVAGLESWHDLTVEEDQVVAARRIPRPDEPPGYLEGYPVPLHNFLTVAELFRRIATRRDDSLAVSQLRLVDAEFDVESGLPTWVQFSGPQGITDAGMSIWFRRLRDR